MNTATLPTLPQTITLDYQPYGCVTLSHLRWEVESERDWSNGGVGIRHRTVLRGTVIEGNEAAYLFGHTAVRSAVGQSRTIYGVREAEISRGHIVRVAG